jgi:hypothetical protein
MKNEIGKDLEGSYRGLIEIHLPGGTDEDQ